MLDSSTLNLPFTIIPSAYFYFLPFLITLHFICNASSCNFSNAFSLSDIVDINDVRSIAITIPTVSYQSKSLNKNITFKTRAISKILIIGSLNVTTLMSYSQSQQQI